jgi:hypothetical protein
MTSLPPDGDTVDIECETGLEEYADAKELHPDYTLMECWNCGHTEWIGPNRHKRVCHRCFMDNSPSDHSGDSTVEGPDGQQYVDYRLLWYGDVSWEEARKKYRERTSDIRERARRDRARDRTVRL